MLSIHQAAAAEIEWPDGTAIVGDGEDLGEATTIEARLLPGAAVTGGDRADWRTKDLRIAMAIVGFA